jgi:hypothetical protein
MELDLDPDVRRMRKAWNEYGSGQIELETSLLIWSRVLSVMFVGVRGLACS